MYKPVSVSFFTGKHALYNFKNAPKHKKAFYLQHTKRIAMPKKLTIVLNWILLIAVLVVNALANALPINGLNTAQISDLYPNLFVPAGFTFSIWGFIYLLLILHVVYSTYILANEKRSTNAIGRLVQTLNPLFWLTCLFNISWIFAWQYLQVKLSVAIMIVLFITLLRIFSVITMANKEIKLGYMEHISLETPFIIYFGWITVALIANVTALLVSLGVNPPNPALWAVVMIAVAGIIGILLSVLWHRPAYTAVIMWALFGIYSKHGADTKGIAAATLAAIFACLLAAGFGFWMKRKLLFRASAQTE